MENQNYSVNHNHPLHRNFILKLIETQKCVNDLKKKRRNIIARSLKS